jgi:hypothetical protein
VTLAPTWTRCTPAYLTRRDPDRPTIGADVAATARLLGRPLIPWQRELVDVAGELRPDGRFARRYVVTIVPRRAGKTLGALAYALTVTRRRRGSKAFYASHRRETAAALWRDDWLAWLEDSPLCPRHVHLRRSNGSEAITWRHNRSTFRLLPPNGNAMRSFAADLAFVDEAREFDLDAGAELEGAAFPTQTTGLGGQAWILSNAGTSSSTWLAKWRDLGRASIADPTSPICYLEYAAPADADPDDPMTLALAHPGVGFHVLADAIYDDRAVMTPDSWACEYLGWWPEALIDSALVDAWTAGAVPVLELGAGLTFAVELDEQRSTAMIVAVADAGDGRLAVELLEHRPHGSWLGPRVAELVDRWAPGAVTFDAGGPAAALAPDLAEVATNVVGLNTRETAAAAGFLYDRILAGDVAHNGDPILDAAIRAGRRRRVGGSWMFDRRQDGAGALIGATLAAWVHRNGAGRAPNIA